MYSCWVPNRERNNCELISNVGEPLSGYCNPSPEMQKKCVNDCVDHMNHTLIQNCKEKLVHEKFCTLEDCIESCNLVQDEQAKMACQLYCDRSNFIKSSDYDYLYYCNDKNNTCSKNCKDALRCRFQNYTPHHSCKINICKNSCNYSKDPSCYCNKIYGNYCSKYSVENNAWKYNYRDASFSPDKCNQIDNELWLRTQDENGNYTCQKNSGHCKWHCPENKKAIKMCHSDPQKKCFESKNNCCQNNLKCMMKN
jgi:hypothetical protein